MGKGKAHDIAGGAGHVSYTGKLKARLRKAGDTPVSVEVTFGHLDNYHEEAGGREYNAPMWFWRGGYIKASKLLAQIQAAEQQGKHLQYWRDMATGGRDGEKEGAATSVGGVKRIALQFHEKWSASGTKPEKRGG